MHLSVHRFYVLPPSSSFADQVDQTKIGFPLLLEASWLLTANEALVAALETALAEEGVRPRDRSL